MKPSRISIFCSSSSHLSPLYFSEVRELAKSLAQNEIEVIYGGAKVGLMGCLADTVLEYGGRVYGVIPEYLNRPGIVHEHLTELRVVGDLLDRKRHMLKGSEAVVALPGGVGTIDEITEIMALKQLGEYSKDIYFFNFMDSWQALLDTFVELKERGFISEALEDLYKVVPSSLDLLRSWGL